MKGKGGRGALLQVDVSATLGTSQDQTVFIQRIRKGERCGKSGTTDNT